MENINYRLEGLKRFVTNDLIEWLGKDHGFLRADFEVIGAILFLKYKGEDLRLEKMFENTTEIIKEANELLERLRNKNC